MNDASATHPKAAGGFAHLHLHTEYSLLDGGNQIKKLVARLNELGMSACAITDHGNLFGAVSFYTACREKGIKPILGVEAYVTPPGKPRQDRTYSGGGEGGYHLVLLAENNTGWKNLLVLCSEAYLTGFYYKPRIDRELLAKHGEGLIAINGHLGSEIGDHLLAYQRSHDRKHWDAAVESARWHKETFGPERFYVELQHHVPEQNAINPLLITLAREVGVPLVCDNDAHFLRAEDHDAHDTLICISTGKGKSSDGRMKYPREVYVKSEGEMEAVFAEYGAEGREALDNTARIAARCNVELSLGEKNTPMVRVRRRGGARLAGEWADLPATDDARFAGDLTAWYRAYCDEFEVVPFRLTPGAGAGENAATIAAAKAECDDALRRLAEAGFVWRYGVAALGGPMVPIGSGLSPQLPDRATRLSPLGFEGKDPYPPDTYGLAPEVVVQRHDLPHYDISGATYFVTWCTAKGRSLDDRARDIVFAGTKHFDDKRCRVYAVCIMPDHVHWLVRPYEGVKLVDLVMSVKEYTAREVNKAEARKGSLWEGERFDHIIRNQSWFEKFLWYVLDNPIVAGLCAKPDEYRWIAVHSDACVCLQLPDSKQNNFARPDGDHRATQEGERRIRLDRELRILADKNISAYFLIVWDFVNWGRQRGIPAAARGSGVGTMVGYALGLSNACPVRYGLLFERFTDPDRDEYPDIDIDLCQDGRAAVINYVREKYGHVAQIITFGTLKARAAIRDVGRVLEMTIPEVDRVARLVPEQLNITIAEAIEKEPDLKRLRDTDPRVRQLIENAIQLEGHTRHAGVHAAGVIVATRPLDEIVPLYRQPGNESNELITQWDGPTCEKMGLLKMDFLGLRTLSVVERCKKLIRETLGEAEIWAAVGRGEEYQKWRSGGVAEWHSEDQNVPRPDRVAAGDGPDAGRVHRDPKDAQIRDVRADQPDAAGGELDPNEHRRGVRAPHPPGVHPRPADRPGLPLRTDDRLRTGHEHGVDSGDQSSAGTPGGGGPASGSPDPILGEQDKVGASRLNAASAGSVLHSATPPLRHSATSSHPLDLDRLSCDDQRVFDLFRRGETTGIFQFESGGMRRLLVEMKPDRLEDLIAANALFRPGPMDLIPDYNRRKHGQEDVPKLHEIVDRHAAETYGVMVYQEQVMQIVHGLGGIKLRDAYTLIKNISKKQHDKIAKVRPKFVEGARAKGLSESQANELFALIEKFAGYGFNKSHSTGYAIVAYQTAYLKTYFPNQYMAAFLTYESQASKVSEWIPYLEDCRRTRFVEPATGRVLKVGVEVRPPDATLSQADFTVVFDEGEPRDAAHGHVRFGLKALKGAGDKAIEAIIAERGRGGPYTSLFDFCERLPAGTVNKTTLESLIRSGAFDQQHGRAARAAMSATIEQALNAGAKLAADKAAGQGGLFMGGGKATKAPAPVSLARAEAWSEAETLKQEKETLGFYISSHPLERWRSWGSAFATTTVGNAKELVQDTRVVLAAMVQSVRTVIVKNGKSAGQKMGILTIEDLTGACEAVLFAENFAKFGHLAAAEQVIFVLGRLDLARGDPQVIVDRLVPIECVPLDSGRLRLFVDETKLNGGAAAAVARAAEVIRGGPPPAKVERDAEKPTEFAVEVYIGTEFQVAVLAADPRLRVPLAPAMVKDLEATLGAGMVKVAGATVEKPEANGKGKWRGRRGGDDD